MLLAETKGIADFKQFFELTKGYKTAKDAKTQTLREVFIFST